ncbi:MAG TPA: PAS domain-containing protein [Bacillota bacterium]
MSENPDGSRRDEKSRYSSTDLFEDLPAETLLNLLDALPVDVSLVDAEDKLAYFNLPREGRIFARAKTDIGRKVQRCHPPKSVDRVQRIIDDFRAGRREAADFWFEYHGKFISIRYFPVRDKAGNYLGTVETTQEISGLRKLEGERRILDEDTPRV